MELQTISGVSKEFGISARMLRYYEEVGLVKSIRQENNSYRFYDEAALKHLQQIIILRKLQIPVKKIGVILNNPKAATAIDIFKENISEIENEINALATIKSILEKFVAELEKLIDIQMNLDLLNESSVQKLAESLSLVQKNIKERLSMNELNSANETINRARQNLVRIVYRPTETVAKMWCEGCDPPDETAKNIMEKFIMDADLLKIKPDFKVFSHGVGDESGAWFFVTIPEDLEVSEPFTKARFEGGLWAVVTVTRENNDGWAVIDEWDSDIYEGDVSRPRHEVYFNPLNILGLKNTELFNSVFNFEYLDIYCSIREIEKLTDEQKGRLYNLLKNTENLILKSEPIEIKLTSMKKHGEIELKYKNGLMIIKADGYDNGMSTEQQYKLPLKIETRIKTDGEIKIQYANGAICFNSIHFRNALAEFDIMDGELNVHKKRGIIPVDDFFDIEWIIGKEVMTVKANGEIQHISDNYGHIKAFAENPNFNLFSAVTITAQCGSTITVESLRVTEL